MAFWSFIKPLSWCNLLLRWFFFLFFLFSHTSSSYFLSKSRFRVHIVWLSLLISYSCYDIFSIFVWFQNFLDSSNIPFFTFSLSKYAQFPLLLICLSSFTMFHIQLFSSFPLMTFVFLDFLKTSLFSLLMLYISINQIPSAKILTVRTRLVFVFCKKCEIFHEKKWFNFPFLLGIVTKLCLKH